MPPTRVKKVYVVEDDTNLRALLERVLGLLCALRTFESGRAALNALQAVKPDVLLTYLGLPDLCGEDLVRAAGQLPTPPPRVVVMSGDRERLSKAARWAEATVPKPFSIPALMGALERDTPAR